MSDDVLVRVENVSKRFCRSLKRSLWYGLQDLGSEIGGRRHGGGSGLPQSSADVQLRPDAFWAVKDVSFPVAHTPHLVCPTAKFLRALDRLPPEPPGSPARTNCSAACRQRGPTSIRARTGCSPNTEQQLPLRQPAS